MWRGGRVPNIGETSEVSKTSEVLWPEIWTAPGAVFGAFFGYILGAFNKYSTGKMVRLPFFRKETTKGGTKDDVSYDPNCTDQWTFPQPIAKTNWGG